MRTNISANIIIEKGEMEYVSANKTTGVELTSSLRKAWCVRLVTGAHFDVTIVQILGGIIAKV